MDALAPATYARRDMRLNARERRTIGALLEDAVGGGRVPIDLEVCCTIVEGVLMRAAPETRFGWRLMLFALEWLSFLVAGAGFGRFSAHPPEERKRIMESMRTSRLYFRRAMFKGLVAPIYVGHYGRTSAQKALGYDAASIGARYRDLPREGGTP